jgi:RimJ/RimL family protein N-acetyltransferase
VRLEAGLDAVKLMITQASQETLDERTKWRYGSPYEFYDGDQDPVLNPERFFEARDEQGELVGFYYFQQKEDALEYGLGLSPELTGKGLGLEFVRSGLEFARRRFAPERIVLSVAAFNERARIVYERAGFRLTGSHVRRFERWGEVEFLDMEEA